MAEVQDICDILDVMCPMHVVVDITGHMIHVGPTLQKLRPEKTLPGQRFLETFELYRPRAVNSMQRLLATCGRKLHLRFRDQPATALKGLLMASPQHGGAIVNLSFGISILDAVRDYALTSADFSATDLTIEMLYLIEAKSAAMAASRQLNLRLQGAMIAAEEQSFTDTLTGLKNRRALDHILPRAVQRGGGLAVMSLDLDYFKSVNDSLGHAAGDLVLQQVARVLVEETRREDTLARVGGDEFVLLFAGLDGREKLSDVARRIIERLQKPIPYSGRQCRISASIGIVLVEDSDADGDGKQLLANADLALYASKHMGRSRFTFFEPALAAGPPPGSDGLRVGRGSQSAK